MQNGTTRHRLHDKVAIVTGAGQGIGREIALRFSQEGARVVVADLNEQQAAAVATEIGAAGGHAMGLKIDVTQPALIAAVIEESLRRFGRLDVLVNNAGIGSNEPVLEMSLEEWERNLRVNLTGTFLCAQAA